MPKSHLKSSKSNVWDFFTRIGNGELCICNLCGRHYKTGGGTTNLRNHLFHKHPFHTKTAKSEKICNTIATDSDLPTSAKQPRLTVTESEDENTESNRREIRASSVFQDRDNQSAIEDRQINEDHNETCKINELENKAEDINDTSSLSCSSVAMTSCSSQPHSPSQP